VCIEEEFIYTQNKEPRHQVPVPQCPATVPTQNAASTIVLNAFRTRNQNPTHTAAHQTPHTSEVQKSQPLVGKRPYRKAVATSASPANLPRLPQREEQKYIHGEAQGMGCLGE